MSYAKMRQNLVVTMQGPSEANISAAIERALVGRRDVRVWRAHPGASKHGDRFVRHIPVVSKIYKALRDVIDTLFSSKGNSFSQVVLVRFPHSGMLAVGLIAKVQTPEHHDKEVSVYIPGAPNPTAGFILNYRYEELSFVDVKVEEAMKFIISCGIMVPEGLFKRQF